MEIEFAPCYTDRALFLRLAKDYIETLRMYDPRIVWDEASVSEWIWHSQFIIEDRTIQGFVVTEEIDYKIYRNLLYIGEFYIAPEARRCGVGKEAVRKLLRNTSISTSTATSRLIMPNITSPHAGKNFWKKVKFSILANYHHNDTKKEHLWVTSLRTAKYESSSPPHFKICRMRGIT